MDGVLDDAEDVQLFTLSHADRLIPCVGSFQPHAIWSTAKALDGVGPVHGNIDDAAVHRLRCPINHQEITVQDADILMESPSTRIMKVAARFSIRYSVRSSGVSR